MWILVVLAAGSVALGRDLYVAPTGTPAGDGSREKPLDVFTALSAQSPAQPGDTIYLMGGVYEGKLKEDPQTKVTTRESFALAVSGSREKPIRVMPVPGQSAHLNGTGALTSSYAQYIGLEIGDLKWDPTERTHKNDTAVNATGGTGAKLINCNIFGGSMGTGLWSPARDIEVYGCLVHDFGTMDPDAAGRGHGHAFYTQNETGTKVIAHNIAYRGCGWNLHVYTQQGQIIGFDVIENIMYIAGARKPGQTMDNYLVYGYVPADRIRMIGNVGYQPTSVEAWRPNMRFSYLRPVQNGTGEIKDNYLMGAFYGVSLGDSKKVTMTGNTIWSTGILVEINSAPTGSALGTRDPKPDLKSFALEDNTYIDNGQPKPFHYGNSEQANPANLVSFADWQALGLDKNSKMLPGKDGKPTGTKVFVFPNKYEKGRANVGIFNWDNLDRVEADLANVLAGGQAYRVYNCLDIKQTIGQAKPVLEGKYQGGKVALPMRKDPISPNFDAFLVLPVQ
jgi:hypothetical protein